MAPVRPIEQWLAHWDKLLVGFDFSGRPLDVRKRLRYAFRTLEYEDPVLAILFGSLSRGEPANDVDLILVREGFGFDHVYRRVDVTGIRVDLNLCSMDWLASVAEDREWGYCIAESYLLAAGSKELEKVWRRSANRYWSPQVRARRAKAFRTATKLLLAASAAAASDGFRSVARLLTHEGLRSVACGVIDGWGTRVFSHRSFLSELTHACQRAAVPRAACESLMRGLAGPSPTRRAGASNYVEIRRRISELMRISQFESALGYRTADPIDRRHAVLRREANWPRLEHLLIQVDATDWLPTNCDTEPAFAVLDVVASLDSPRHAQPMLRHPRIDRLEIPRQGQVQGARWVELDKERLKVILSTGGCRTPSCSFCALPIYGRRMPSGKVAETVRRALQLHSPRELALYNDGSILNPREVAVSELLEACEEVRKSGIERLWIESIPRFVTRDLVSAVRQASQTELVVGMGFQSCGNWFSMTTLGRPDVDALFERAIEEIHDADSRVRLYLLWAFEGANHELWLERLRASLNWAIVRNVDLVTVCPHVPIAGEPLPRLPDLFRVLASARRRSTTEVTISFPSLPSCGPASTHRSDRTDRAQLRM